MASIKISSKVEAAEWRALQALAREQHKSIAGVLTEAIADYVRKRRLRPIVETQFAASMADNDELAARLGE
ncbi:MAG: hypothetical protein KJO82_08275 [Gammaproteobacteria bacterium]|nr:hypothetical protein [Gammaproteobacteria bacterium]